MLTLFAPHIDTVLCLSLTQSSLEGYVMASKMPAAMTEVVALMGTAGVGKACDAGIDKKKFPEGNALIRELLESGISAALKQDRKAI